MENEHHRKAENKLYRGAIYYTTHQNAHFKAKRYIIISASFNNRSLYSYVSTLYIYKKFSYLKFKKILFTHIYICKNTSMTRTIGSVEAPLLLPRLNR